MDEADRPVAGPALGVAGGLILFLLGLLAYESGGTSEGAEAFLLRGPALGPLILLAALAAYAVPRYRLVLGSVMIPLSVLGFFLPALGFVAGPVFGVAGGALCVYFESRTDAGDWSDRTGWPGSFRRNYWAVTVVLVAGAIYLLALGTALPGGVCPMPATCSGVCPAVGAECYGAPAWVVLLVSAIVTGPLTFRLRAEDHPLPLPA